MFRPTGYFFPSVLFNITICFFITEIKTIDNFTKELDTQSKNKQQL